MPEEILYELESDEGGYPPADIEQLWAERWATISSRSTTPLFLLKASVARMSVKHAQIPKENLGTGALSVHLLQHASLYRVTREPRSSAACRPCGGFHESTITNRLFTELSQMPGLVAVDTDPVSINKVLGVLQSGEIANLWEYEGAAFRR